MYLHEAIEKLLKEKGYPMTTSEIADELNRNKWYQKKDGSPISDFQIHGRTRKYPHMFNRNGSTVFLAGYAGKAMTKSQKPAQKIKDVKMKPELLEKILMNEKNYKLAGIIDDVVPDTPGLYCFRIKNVNALPNLFSSILTERKYNIIYIGIASQSLKKRLNQELRAKGHGTFFRSIGGVLGYRPEKGSLKTRANKKNYKFRFEDELKIIKWINANLKVNWVANNENLDDIESNLILSHSPLLNIAKNPLALKELQEIRRECVMIANS